MLLYLVALAGGLSVVAVLLVKEFKSQSPTLGQVPLNAKGQLPQGDDTSAVKVEPLRPKEIKSTPSPTPNASAAHLTLNETLLQNDVSTSQPAEDKSGSQKFRNKPDDKAHFLKDALKLGGKKENEQPGEEVLAEKLAEMDRLTSKIRKLEELLDEKNRDLETIQKALEVENHNHKEFDVVKQALDDQIQELRTALKDVKVESDKHKQEADFYKRKVALVEEELREKHLDLKQTTARLEEIQKKSGTAATPADTTSESTNDDIPEEAAPAGPAATTEEVAPASVELTEPPNTPLESAESDAPESLPEAEESVEEESYEEDEPIKLRKDPIINYDAPDDAENPPEPSPPTETDTDTPMP